MTTHQPDDELNNLVRDACSVVPVSKSEFRARLLKWSASKENAAEIRGAGIAAQEINRELGLELTTNGQYYLDRAPAHQEKG